MAIDKTDADAIAEAALKIVFLDGLDTRDAFVILPLFGVKIVPLPKGQRAACYCSRTRTVGVDPFCDVAILRALILHEFGHIAQILQRIPPPHDESFTDEIGWAAGMNRGYIVRLLTEHTVRQIVEMHKGFLPDDVLLLRVGRVWSHLLDVKKVG